MAEPRLPLLSVPDAAPAQDLPAVPERRLGKLAPKYDKRTLMLANYLNVAALPPTPATRSWDKRISSWGMMRNDVLGDCTCAALGHQIQVWTANNGKELTLPDSAVVTAYSAVSGYDPTTGANDIGAVELDVLNYWYKTGIAGHKLGAFAAVTPPHHDLVKATINLFGGIYMGIALPMSAQTQNLWDVVGDGKTGPAIPGSWGGHATIGVDYDDKTITLITWGQLLKMTWAFWDAYVDECYACLSAEWFADNVVAPSGFDLPALTRDLALVAGKPDPGPAPFVPNPQIVAWLTWEKQAVQYITDRYLEGPDSLAQALAEQVVLAQEAAWLQSFLSGAQSVPRVPPLLPLTQV